MKIIFVPDSKEELTKFIEDVNYNINGRNCFINSNEFDELWKSQILFKFSLETGIFIDDFETTIIEVLDQLKLFQKIVINDTSLSRRNKDLKQKIIELVEMAISKDSGLIFFL